MGAAGVGVVTAQDLRSRCGAALLLVVAVLCACSGTAPSGDRGEPRTIRTAEGIDVELGRRVVLLGNDALGLRYFPDESVVLLERHPRLRLIVVAAETTYLVEGDDLRNLDRATPVLHPGPPGSFDNGYAGIGGVYEHPDGTLYALYHAEDQEDMPRLPALVPGFYASIGSARSTDGGSTWEKLGPAITSAKPKSWSARPEHGDKGAAVPSLVRDRDGSRLLAYYTEHSYVEDRGPPICVARADLREGPPTPGRWRKLHAGRFDEPGLGGRDTPILPPTFGQPHVVFSRALDRFVMVMIGAWWREMEGTQPLQRSGLYVAFSRDGITWSKPEPLFVDYTLPRLGQSISWQPTVLWDEGSDTEGWLVYSHSPRWGHRPGERPHFMVGRRLRLAERGGAP